jgi:cytidylate kinase
MDSRHRGRFPRGETRVIVAIDGPAGSGKTTVARTLARRLGFGVLPSGETYRALAWAALRDGTAIDDPVALTELADRISIDVVPAGADTADRPRIRVDGQDVTEAIQAPAVANAASALSRFPAVRERLVALQRAVAERLGDVVAEGRDMTTVVFADARVKVFLDAAPEERARRRHAELAARSGAASPSLERVQADIASRDRQDTTRAAAPLTRARDARYLDTTGLSVGEVVDRIVEWVRAVRTT